MTTSSDPTAKVEKGQLPSGLSLCRCGHRRDSHIGPNCVALVSDTVCTCPKFRATGMESSQRDELWL